jgi:hypothetical protein
MINPSNNAYKLALEEIVEITKNSNNPSNKARAENPVTFGMVTKSYQILLVACRGLGVSPDDVGGPQKVKMAEKAFQELFI